MIKYKKLLVFLLVIPLLLQLGLAAEKNSEEPPVKIKFQNTSDHLVVAHVLSDTMIESSHYIEPGTEMEIDVAFGNRIRLDYKPKPHQSLLSQLGSLNELFRTILIRNDGKHVFIEEKFSGQRVTGEGQKRAPKGTISDPELERQKKLQRDAGKTKNKKKDTTRKSDPDKPENKTKKEKE